MNGDKAKALAKQLAGTLGCEEHWLFDYDFGKYARDPEKRAAEIIAEFLEKYA